MSEKPAKPHPAQPIVVAFIAMRDACEHYHGPVQQRGDHQCSHKECDEHWCEILACPLIHEAANEADVPL